jgi:hypothetical protein
MARKGQERKAYEVLVGKIERNWPLGRPIRKSDGGIKMDLRETDWEGVKWIQLAQDKDQ